MRRFLAVAGALCVFGCADFTPPPEPLTLQLTAAQASDLNARLGSYAVGNPDLAWLTDSASMILRAGTIVVEADLDTDFGTGPFYGIGLHRAVSTSSAPFSTFHAILFNTPSNPTHVIVLSGWAEGVPAPSNGSGMGSQINQPVTFVAANAHFFRTEAAGVTHWRAITGHLAFNTQVGRGPCPDFVSTASTACEVTEFMAMGTVTGSQRESGSGDGEPVLALWRTDLHGVRLRLTAP